MAGRGGDIDGIDDVGENCSHSVMMSHKAARMADRR